LLFDRPGAARALQCRFAPLRADRGTRAEIIRRAENRAIRPCCSRAARSGEIGGQQVILRDGEVRLCPPARPPTRSKTMGRRTHPRRARTSVQLSARGPTGFYIGKTWASQTKGPFTGCRKQVCPKRASQHELIAHPCCRNLPAGCCRYHSRPGSRGGRKLRSVRNP